MTFSEAKLIEMSKLENKVTCILCCELTSVDRIRKVMNASIGS